MRTKLSVMHVTAFMLKRCSQADDVLAVTACALETVLPSLLLGGSWLLGVCSCLGVGFEVVVLSTVGSIVAIVAGANELELRLGRAESLWLLRYTN